MCVLCVHSHCTIAINGEGGREGRRAHKVVAAAATERAVSDVV